MKIKNPFALSSITPKVSHYKGFLTRVSLRVKILVPILAVVIGFGGVISWRVQEKTKDALWKEFSVRVEAILAQLTSEAVQEILVEDYAGLQEMINRARKLPDVIYIFVLDGNGDLLAHSFREGVPNALLAAVELPLDRGRQVRPLRNEKGAFFDYALKMLGGRLGAIHVGVTPARIRQQARKVGRNILFITFLAALISVGLVYLVTFVVTEPVRSLTKSMAKVGEGDFTIRADLDTGDEIGELAKQFNAMAEKLAQWEGQLEDAQRLLLRSERLATIGKIASGVAHEIGNPLHAVSELSHALEERPDSVDTYLPLIQQGLQRIRKVLLQLNNYARERSLHRRTMDIHEVIRDSISLLDYKARNEDVNLVFEPAEGLPKIYGDPAALGQIITNVIINSLEAITAVGTVHIQTFFGSPFNNHPRQVGVAITDDGIGIEREHIDRIFDPFFTTKEPGQGTGLGLAICQDIVAVHGGEIQIESEKGKGTILTLWFPMRGGDAIE